MAALATQQIVNAGVIPTYAAAAGGGDTVAPGDTTFVHVKNASVGSITVTVDSVAASSYGTDVDLVVAIAAGAEKMIGPLPASRFAQTTTGLVNISYSGVTSLTVGAFRF